MRYGYWLPVFGGWLRNVEDEGMEPTWAYVQRLARRSEELGYDLTLIAELLWYRAGGRTKRVATAARSTSKMIATRELPSGSKSSRARGPSRA